MSNVNVIAVSGFLTADVELKHIEHGSGFDVADFAIGVNHYNGKDREVTVSFFNIKSFGHSAKFVTSYCGKGDLVFIQGELVQERWVKDNQTYSKIFIKADNVQLLRKKTDGQSGREQEPDECDF